MAKLTPTGTDYANSFSTGELTANGSGVAYSAQTRGGLRQSNKFNVFVWGTFVATATLERSFDGGTTWFATPTSFTETGHAVVEEPEEGMLYRVTVSGFTSGTVNYRISQ